MRTRRGSVMRGFTRLAALAAGATAALACKDSSGPGKAVSLSFAGRQASVSAAPPFALPTAFISAVDNLVITKAEVVLREIELERVEVVDCDVTPEPAGCEDFEVGPIRLNIPTGAGATTQVTIDVEPGTYDEVEFEIHKVSGDDPAEAAFRAANPDLLGQSIKVTGTFNGQAFTFFSDLNVEQEQKLVPPLVISDQTTSTNLTVQVNLGDWFKNAAGTGLVNPATANKGQPNENLVKENVKKSFKAFEDKDKDGNEG